MKDRMNYYLNTTVPAAYKPADPNALKEARKHGIWGPWMQIGAGRIKLVESKERENCFTQIGILHLQGIKGKRCFRYSFIDSKSLCEWYSQFYKPLHC